MLDRTAPGHADNGVATALVGCRRTALDLADELLTHLPDLGDATTQRAVDAWVEQAADTLRAAADAIEERLLDAGRAPSAPTAHAEGRRLP